jgi:hypothetical protein
LGIRSYDISMSREFGAMIYQWVGNWELQYINGLGIRSYDISMSRELGGMIYQWVGN